MNARVPVITVDGPSGVGKGTLCQRLASRLGFHLLDSGALYRLTALAALRRNLALEDESRVAVVAAGLEVEFLAGTEGSPRIVLEGVEVGAELRSETCGNAASRVAALPAVRAALLQRQRDFRQPPGLIADGRDMGTVVFPDAELKLFLIASAEERARRRYQEMRNKGMDANFDDVLRDLRARDEQDTHRAVDPLRAAEDAVTVDSTHLTFDEVVEAILRIVAGQTGGAQA